MLRPKKTNFNTHSQAKQMEESDMPQTNVTRINGQHKIYASHVMVMFLDREDLTAHQTLVGVALARYSDEHGKSIHPSINTICKKTGLGRSAVKKAMKELCELGLLSKEQCTAYMTNDYTINIYGLTECRAYGDRGGVAKRPGGGRNTTGGGSQYDHNLTNDLTNKTYHTQKDARVCVDSKNHPKKEQNISEIEDLISMSSKDEGDAMAIEWIYSRKKAEYGAKTIKEEWLCYLHSNRDKASSLIKGLKSWLFAYKKQEIVGSNHIPTFIHNQPIRGFNEGYIAAREAPYERKKPRSLEETAKYDAFFASLKSGVERMELRA